MEVIAILSFIALFWLIWQLIQAKKLTRFKRYIDQELKALVVKQIKEDLENTRTDLYPNNAAHEEATLYYWTKYRARILQRALRDEIIDEKWLKEAGYMRQSQHLFYIEQQVLNER